MDYLQTKKRQLNLFGKTNSYSIIMYTQICEHRNTHGLKDLHVLCQEWACEACMWNTPS